MPTPRLGVLLRHVRGLAGPPGGATDGELLERFVRQRDEEAFTVLVRRHGPLVLGTAGRVLGNRDDAEDVFQAAFLVLARRAAALDRRGSVASWLYTVTHHLALKLRARSARRRVREREVEAMS